MVECECSGYRNYQYHNRVLIDTWWNVNVRDEIIFDFENQF